MEKGEALEQRVGRERVVLGEKCEACERLLVQVGQDTGISRGAQQAGGQAESQDSSS